jgi:hypothetical protein
MLFDDFCKLKSVELSSLQARFAEHILKFEHIDFMMKTATGKTVLFNLLEEYFHIERENVECKKFISRHLTEDYINHLRSIGYIPI